VVAKQLGGSYEGRRWLAAARASGRHAEAVPPINPADPFPVAPPLRRVDAISTALAASAESVAWKPSPTLAANSLATLTHGQEARARRRFRPTRPSLARRVEPALRRDDL
jgi:hypothetical protein